MLTARLLTVVGVWPGGYARVVYERHAGIHPPSPWTEWMTHACENITFQQQLLRAVINVILMSLVKLSKLCKMLILELYLLRKWILAVIGALALMVVQTPICGHTQASIPLIRTVPVCHREGYSVRWKCSNTGCDIDIYISFSYAF